MKRIDAHGLKIAPVLFDFVAKEATPKTGFRPMHSGPGLPPSSAISAPKNRELLAVRDALQAKIDGWHRANKGKPFDMTAYTAFLKEIGYLLPEPATQQGRDRQCRRRDRKNLRPAAGGAAHQCALRAERRQCALGQPVRCASTAPTPSRTIRARRQGLQQGARRQGHRESQGVSRLGRTAGDRQPRRRHRLQRDQRAARGQTEERQRHRAEGRAQFAGYQGDAAAPTAILLVNNGLHIEISIDRGHPIGKDDPAGVADMILESAVSHHSRHGRQRRRCRCRGQGAGLSQHARPDGRHAVGRLRKGRQDAEARAQSRPRLQDAGRQGAHAARPQPAADAQCRPSHVHRRGARQRRAQKFRKAFSTPPSPACSRSTISRARRRRRNSRTGSVYIVKPKMHGPDEVALTCELFGRVEKMLRTAGKHA